MKKKIFKLISFCIILTVSVLTIVLIATPKNEVEALEKNRAQYTPSQYAIKDSTYEKSESRINLSEIYNKDTNGLYSSLKNVSISTDSILVISDAFDLDAFDKISNENSDYLTYHYELNANINYSEVARFNASWLPIGNSQNKFNGTFNGNGFEITNLQIKTYIQSDTLASETSYDYYAMFNYIGESGSISNLGLKNITNAQTIKPDNTKGASTLAGDNAGTINNVYVIDDRDSKKSLGGIAASGGYDIAGFTFINSGTISNCYTYVTTIVSYAVQDYVSFREFVALNQGTMNNCYFLDEAISELKDGKLCYDSGLFGGLTIDKSNVVGNGNYLKNLNALIEAFKTNTNWFVPGYHSKITLNYPFLRGLRESGNENTLVISTAYDFAYLFELMNKNSYFASSDMTYIIDRDIDLSIIPSDSYSYDDYFSAHLTGNDSYDGTLTLLDGSKVSTPTIYYGSIMNHIKSQGFDAYGLFPLFDGSISKLNFYFEDFSSYFEEGSTSITKAIGLISGVAETASFTDVNVYGSIALNTSETKAKIGRYFVGTISGIASRNTKLLNVTASGSIFGNEEENTGLISNQIVGSISGSAIGGLIGYSGETNVDFSKCLSNVEITMPKNPGTDLKVGGILGAGYLNYFSEISSIGQITLSESSNEVYSAGLVGRVYGLTQNLSNLLSYSKISLNETISSLYVSGILNLNLTLTKDNYLAKSKLEGIDVSSVSMGENLELLSTETSYKLSSGMFNLINAKYSVLDGLYSLKNRKQASNWKALEAVSDIIVNINAVPNYAPILNQINSSNTTLKYAFQFRDINLTTSASKSNLKENLVYSGVANGENIDYYNVRNEGNITLDLKDSISALTLKTFKINGVFETLSDEHSANILYNGGDITLNLNSTLTNYDLAVAGICYFIGEINDANNIYDSYNPLNSNYDKSLDGNFNNVINSGNITQANETTPVGFTSSVYISGISIINQGIISQTFNLGNILNTVSLNSSNLNSYVAGISCFMHGSYSQIIDSANNGSLKNVNMSSNASYTYTSGLICRNDLQVYEGTTTQGYLTNTTEYLLYSLNYGEIISYSKASDQTFTSTSYDVPYAIASGILSYGLLSMVNTVNYGNVYGSEVISGMLGSVNLSLFQSISSTNQVSISNSINYANVKALRRVKTVDGSPINVSYSDIYNLNTLTNTDIVAIPYQGEKEYAGSVIALINYNNSSNAQYIKIRYLLNFNNIVSLVGLEVNVPTSIKGSTSTMFTAKENDRYLNSMIVYSPLSSLEDESNNIGIFSPNFAFRKAIEGDSNYIDVSNYPTDSLLSDYFQFVAFSKINDSILSRLGWNIIAYQNASELFVSNLNVVTTILSDYSGVNNTKYNELLNTALSNNTWIASCDKDILNEIVKEILASKSDAEDLQEILKYLLFESSSNSKITKEIEETIISAFIENVTNLEKTDLLNLLENLMTSDLMTYIIVGTDSNYQEVKSKIDSYIEALNTDSLKDLANQYLKLLKEDTNYTNFFTDAKYANARYKLLDDLLSNFSDSVYQDILKGISTDYSESAQIVDALNQMTSSEAKALYQSILTNNNTTNIASGLINLVMASDIYKSLEAESDTIATNFGDSLSNASDQNAVDLWNAIKNDDEVKSYLESVLDDVYDANNIQHKGIYQVATEYRNSYQSNNGWSSTFTVNSSTNAITVSANGRYRARAQSGLNNTKYIYVPDDYVSEATYFYGPYVSIANKNLMFNSSSSSYPGGAQNIYYNLDVNGSTTSTQRYVPIYIDLDQSHLSNLISNSVNPDTYEFMWNDSANKSSDCQWVSFGISTKVPTNNPYVLKRIKEDSSYNNTGFVYKGYDFAKAETQSTTQDLSDGIVYNNVKNSDSSWKKEDVLISYCSASIITGIYYQQDQWSTNGTFLTAKEGQGYGVITTRYIDYSLDDLINVDGILTKGKSSGTTSSSDEIAIIKDVLNNYLLNTTEGKKVVTKAYTNAILKNKDVTGNSDVTSKYLTALLQNENLILNMIQNIYVDTSVLNYTTSLTLNNQTYTSVSAYLVAYSNSKLSATDLKKQIILKASKDRTTYLYVIDYIFNDSYGYFAYITNVKNTVYQYYVDNKSDNFDEIVTYLKNCGLSDSEINEVITNYKDQNVNNVIDSLNSLNNIGNEINSGTSNNITIGSGLVSKSDSINLTINDTKTYYQTKTIATADTSITYNNPSQIWANRKVQIVGVGTFTIKCITTASENNSEELSLTLNSSNNYSGTATFTIDSGYQASYEIIIPKDSVIYYISVTEYTSTTIFDANNYIDSLYNNISTVLTNINSINNLESFILNSNYGTLINDLNKTEDETLIISDSIEYTFGTNNTIKESTYTDNYINVAFGSTSSDYISAGVKSGSSRYLKLIVPSNSYLKFSIEVSSNGTSTRNLSYGYGSTSYSNSNKFGSVSSKTPTKFENLIYNNLENSSSYDLYINFDNNIWLYSLSIEISKKANTEDTGTLSFNLSNKSLVKLDVSSTNQISISDGTNSYNLSGRSTYYLYLDEGSYTITKNNVSISTLNAYQIDSLETKEINYETTLSQVLNDVGSGKTFETYSDLLLYYDRYNSIKDTNYTISDDLYKLIVKDLYLDHNSNETHSDKLLYDLFDSNQLNEIIKLILIADDNSFGKLIEMVSDTDILIKAISNICSIDASFLQNVMEKANISASDMSDTLKNKFLAGYVSTDYLTISEGTGNVSESVLNGILSDYSEDYQYITSSNTIDSIKFINFVNYINSLISDSNLHFNLTTDGYGIYAMASSQGILNGQFVPDNMDLSIFDANYSSDFSETTESSAAWRGGTTLNKNDISDTNSVNYKFFKDMKQLKLSIATTIFEIELIDEAGNSIYATSESIDLTNKEVHFYIPSNSKAIDGTYQINEESGHYLLAYNAKFDDLKDIAFKLDNNMVVSNTVKVIAEDTTVITPYLVYLHKTNAVTLELESATIQENEIESLNKTTDSSSVTYDLREAKVSALDGTFTLNILTTNLENAFNFTPYIHLMDENSNEVLKYSYLATPYVKNSNLYNNGDYGSGSLIIAIRLDNSLPKGVYTLLIDLNIDTTYKFIIEKEVATGNSILSMSLIDYTNEEAYVNFISGEATSYISFGRGYKESDFIDLESGIPSYLSSFSISENAISSFSATKSIDSNNLMTYTVLIVITSENGDTNTYTHYLKERDPFTDAKNSALSGFNIESYDSTKYVETIVDGEVTSQVPNEDGTINLSFEREDSLGNQLTPKYHFNYYLDGFYQDLEDSFSVKSLNNGIYYDTGVKYYGFYVNFLSEALPIENEFNLVYQRTISWNDSETYSREYICPSIIINKKKSNYALLDGITFLQSLGAISQTQTYVSLDKMTPSNYLQSRNNTDFTQNNGILSYNSVAINSNDFYIVGAVNGEELTSYSPIFNLKTYAKIYQYIEISNIRYTYHEFVNSSNSLEKTVFLTNGSYVYQMSGTTVDSVGSIIGELKEDTDGNSYIIHDGITWYFSDNDGVATQDNTALYMDFIGTPLDNEFWYINYMTISEDLSVTKDYHIAVVDLTNNIKFNFTIIDESKSLSLDALCLNITSYEYSKDLSESPKNGNLVSTLNAYFYKDDYNYVLRSPYDEGTTYTIRALSYAYFYFNVSLPQGYSSNYKIESYTQNNQTLNRYDDSIQYYKKDESDNSFLPKESLVTQKINVTIRITKNSEEESSWGIVTPYLKQVEATCKNREE